jgi:hypothetical protein
MGVVVQFMDLAALWRGTRELLERHGSKRTAIRRLLLFFVVTRTV